MYGIARKEHTANNPTQYYNGSEARRKAWPWPSLQLPRRQDRDPPVQAPDRNGRDDREAGRAAWAAPRCDFGYDDPQSVFRRYA